MAIRLFRSHAASHPENAVTLNAIIPSHPRIISGDLILPDINSQVGTRSFGIIKRRGCAGVEQEAHHKFFCNARNATPQFLREGATPQFLREGEVQDDRAAQLSSCKRRSDFCEEARHSCQHHKRHKIPRRGPAIARVISSLPPSPKRHKIQRRGEQG